MIDYSVVIRTTGKAGAKYQGLLDSIAALEPQPREDMVLIVEGKGYIVRSAHRIAGPGGPVYSWAMCVEQGGTDDGL